MVVVMMMATMTITLTTLMMVMKEMREAYLGEGNLLRRSEEEVSKIVKSVPIVPYGGATSIEGHTLSPNGGVCIDMSMMKTVKALHIVDMDVVVESGIGWMELNEYLEPHGIFFPLDPEVKVISEFLGPWLC